MSFKVDCPCGNAIESITRETFCSKCNRIHSWNEHGFITVDVFIDMSDKGCLRARVRQTNAEGFIYGANLLNPNTMTLQAAKQLIAKRLRGRVQKAHLFFDDALALANPYENNLIAC